jgi:hypothetical protein
MNRIAITVAETIKKALPGATKGPFTIADISTKSGLSLRDSEVGLQYLVAEHRGHLSVTEKGELLFQFPYGFKKPWEKIEGLARAWSRVKSALLVAAKFVVRAWISIVMVGYVAIFAVILIALMFSKKSDDDDRGNNNGGFAFAMLTRLVLDSLFWTFHPLSPYSASYPTGYKAKRKDEVPFYEKVNRYFFGPEDPPQDPQGTTKKMLALIRAKRGRIGMSDVIKVTGLTGQEADPILAKLMLDYDGEVSVNDNGGIVYTFREIRKTVENTYLPEPAPIWSVRERVKPLTGNTGSINLLISVLNGFNLVMSTFMISQHFTIEKLFFLLSGAGQKNNWTGFTPVAPSGTAILLGYVPFVFSMLLFALPLSRWLAKSAEKRRVDRQNGRRGLLFAVFNRLTNRGVSENAIKKAWEQVSQSPADDKAIVKEVVRLGGELEINEDGTTMYRFKELENELKALAEERESASDSEKHVGPVIFATSGPVS